MIMITPSDPNPDFSTLVDYAMGRLSMENSLKITQELERNPQASKTLDFILGLIDLFEEQHRDDPEN